MNKSLLLSFIILFLIGIFLLMAYGVMSNANSNALAGSILSQSILGIFTMGIVFITMAIMIMFFCYGNSCNRCESITDLGEKSGLILLFTVASFGIVLAVLGGLILSNGDSTETASNNMAVSVMVIGICLTLFISGIAGYIYRKGLQKFFTKGKGTKEPVNARPVEKPRVPEKVTQPKPMVSEKVMTEPKPRVLARMSKMVETEPAISAGGKRTTKVYRSVTEELPALPASARSVGVAERTKVSQNMSGVEKRNENAEDKVVSQSDDDFFTPEGELKEELKL